jgi:hypothetical protein
MKHIVIILIAFSIFSINCRQNSNEPSKDLDGKMNLIAESYVKLILNIGCTILIMLMHIMDLQNGSRRKQR